MRFVKNEWIKLWNQRSTWIMFSIMVLLLLGGMGLNKYFSDDGSTKEARIAENQEDIAFYESLIQDESQGEYTDGYQQEIALIQYRIDNDLPSLGTMTVNEGIDFGITFTLVFVGIFSMVIAASIVSNEFGTGTIKMLLTRPAARWKILLSKLVATILFGLALLATGLVITLISSWILFEPGSPVYVNWMNDGFVQTTAEYYYVQDIGYGLASTVMTIFFAFMLGTIFGSSTLAVSLALGIMFMGSTISFLISKYEFAKYIWFVNDLGQFVEGSVPYFEGLTLGHAVVVNIVYAVIFLGVSFVYFTRRDVTA